MDELEGKEASFAPLEACRFESDLSKIYGSAFGEASSSTDLVSIGGS
jgi:hypothetical protein